MDKHIIEGSSRTLKVDDNMCILRDLFPRSNWLEVRLPTIRCLFCYTTMSLGDNGGVGKR